MRHQPLSSLRIIIATVLLLIVIVIPAFAQSLSGGCRMVNDLSGLYVDGFSAVGFPFNAIEQIVINGGLPRFGSATQVRLEIDGVGVDTDVFPGTVSYTFPADLSAVSLRLWFDGATSVTLTGSCTIVSSPAVVEVVSEPEPCPVFFDGRINNCDTFTSVVLYGKPDVNGSWGLDVYAADGSGLLVSIPESIIAAVPECPEHNTLIQHDVVTDISLWRLPQRFNGTCPFQLNAPATEAGKTYVVIFDTLYPNTYYESWDEWIGQ